MTGERGFEFSGLEYVCGVCGSNEYVPFFSALREAYTLEHVTDARVFPYVRCRECSFVSAYPRLTDRDLDNLYEQNWYAYTESPLSDLLVKFLYRLNRRLPRGTGKKLLDIGAGDGKFLVYALNRGWDAVGCDVSGTARQIARTRGVRVLGMDDLDAVPDCSCDMITLFHVLEHLAHPGEVLRLVRDKLKPDGTCVIQVPVIDSWEFRLFGKRTHWISAPVHVALYTDLTMRRAAGRGGFRVSRIHNDWLTPSMFIFSLMMILERRCRFFIPYPAKKVIAVLLSPMFLPLFMAAALCRRSSVKTYYLRREPDV
jgi:SAM-dependent methyltransferase